MPSCTSSCHSPRKTSRPNVSPTACRNCESGGRGTKAARPSARHPAFRHDRGVPQRSGALRLRRRLHARAGPDTAAGPDVEAIALVVQDPGPYPGPRGLATFVENWKKTGRELRSRIDLADLRDQVRLTAPPLHEPQGRDVRRESRNAPSRPCSSPTWPALAACPSRNCPLSSSTSWGWWSRN